MTPPLVSCICPTGGRRLLLEQALRYFARQTYEPRELVIVDGGQADAKFFPRPTEWIEGPPPTEWAPVRGALVRYLHCAPETTVGARRNLAVEHARGEIILHWDDDDWYSDDRIEMQVAAMVKADRAKLCSVSKLWAYDFARKIGWPYYGFERLVFSGNTLGYWRTAWERIPFRDVQYAEDTIFLHAHADTAGIVALNTERLTVYIRHRRNITTTIEPAVNPTLTAEVRKLMGRDVEFYDALAELFPPHVTNTTWHLPPVRNPKTGGWTARQR